MSTSKVAILTGASRGIGLSIAQFLLEQKHKLVVVSRTAGPLEDLKKKYPEQVAVLAADVTESKTAETAVSLALSNFSRIDSLILNHGTLGNVGKVADCNPEEWRQVFDVNFFSCVTFVQAALPSLRESKGRIVMISSGASVSAYKTWGSYGSSKAAINHLTLTLSTEEPEVTTIAVRPGVVETSMTQNIRETLHEGVDEKVRQRFLDLKAEGKMLRPEQPGNVVSRLAVSGDVEGLSGKFLTWNDKELAAFQDA